MIERFQIFRQSLPDCLLFLKREQKDGQEKFDEFFLIKFNKRWKSVKFLDLLQFSLTYES